MDDDREQDYIEEPPKPSTPWGFFLVLAAIVVVAIVYSVSMFALTAGSEDSVPPETVFGAMAACFTVIGTLVGTYFGVKAGLDGQEKLRHAFTRTADRSRQRPPRDRTDRNQDTSRRGSQDDQPRDTRQHRDPRRGDREDQQKWDQVGV